MFPRRSRRQDDRELHVHGRRCRERVAAGLRLCGSAPQHPRGRILPRAARRVSRPSPTPSVLRPASFASTTSSTSSTSNLDRRSRSRALSRWRQGRHQRAVLFYAAAARHSFPEFFAGVEDIVLTILQPVTIEVDAEMVSAVTVTPAELDEFITVYRAACAEALSAAPRLERGDHCRFCAARPICPAHTGPLLDLAQFTMPSARERTTTLQLLAAGLDLVDAVKDIGTALHDQAKQALTPATCARLRALGRPRRAPLARRSGRGRTLIGLASTVTTLSWKRCARPSRSKSARKPAASKSPTK